MILLSPTDAQIRQVLRAFLLTVLPPGVEVVLGQENRVPEPQSPDFVVMTRINSGRLATNVDAYADAAYQASIAGTVMTVTEILIGEVLVGAAVFGVNVAPGTVIMPGGSGSGGIGAYNVSPAQTVASAVLASGARSATMETEVLYQCDVHGPHSNDNAELISTLFRDEWGFEEFLRASDAAALDPSLITPLHADDPKQIGWQNDQDQWEYRWIVEARIQANQTALNIPQQFFDQFDVKLAEIDATFPP